MLDIGLLVLFYIVALRGKSNVMKRKTSFFCEDRPARLEMAGFTLVEMAIVILIMGILLIPILEAYSHYIKEKRIEDTRENIAAVTSGISGFQDVQARLPCPADATLGPGAANFGKEFDVNCNPAAIGLTAAGMCTAGNGICLVAGQRNLGGAAGATDANELVLIGAVPIVSIRDQGVSERTAVANDAWGRKLTYAVTASLTRDTTYSSYVGEIGVQDEFGNNTAGINGDAHMAVISHGEDGKGGFNESGGVNTPCGVVAAAKDNENCNRDSLFVQSLGHYDATGAMFFDDFTQFSKAGQGSLWAFLPASTDIFNLNNKNVGVNTAVPTQKLDVIGEVRTNTASRAKKICSKTQPTKCFDVYNIQVWSSCPLSNQVMTGFSNGSPVCVTPVFAPPIDTDCGAGWVNGINIDGSVICIP